MTAQKQVPARAGVHPLSIVRAFWKRKLLVITCWVVGSAVAAVVVAKLPAMYSAEALILVDSQKIPDRFVTSTVNPDLQDRIATISQQILSSSHLKKIIDDYNLYARERKKLVLEELFEKMRSDISIKMERGWTGNRPGAFRVAYQGPDPSIVAQVTNRIAQLYIDENLKSREVQAEGTAEFISTQLQDAKKHLDELEAAVSNYKVKHNGELPQQESSIAGELSRLDQQMQSTRESIHRAQADKANLEGMLAIAEATVSALSTTRQVEVLPSGSMAPSSVAAVPGVSRVESLQVQLDGLRTRYGDEHPEVKRLKAELDRAIREEVPDRAPAAAPAPDAARPESAGKSSFRTIPLTPKELADIGTAREHVAALKTQIAAEETEIKARKNDETQISAEINALQSKLGRLPIREQEMAQLTRDYELSKTNYKSLFDKKFAADMATDMETRQKSERFTLLDPPRIPEKPFKPNRPLYGCIGSLASLGLGILLGIALELRENTLLGEWELPKEIPVLGRLPHIDLSVADKPKGGSKFRWRRAIATSAALLFLGALAGAYIIWRL